MKNGVLTIKDKVVNLVNSWKGNIIFSKFKSSENCFRTVFDYYLTGGEDDLIDEFKKFDTKIRNENAVDENTTNGSENKYFTYIHYGYTVEKYIKEYFNFKFNFLDEVYIVGCDTDACIMGTALSLFSYGIKPIVLKDYVHTSSSNPKLNDMALEILKRNIGQENVV